MQNEELLIEAKGISKKFTRDLKKSLFYGLLDILLAIIGKRSTKRDIRNSEFWAVKDVSFQLKRGECLGLIGHNGAGKSTLLKILNGLVRPDQGEVRIRGRVGALIELGSGFNPILTGRENIFINGQILGFSKKEIQEKLDAIISFSELGDFIDSPVQNYSSGMKVRLGFAVAAQMEPDVLIIDEVLAVGDMKFRIKCFNVMSKLLPKTAIIFVSHNMSQITKICDTLLFLKSGEVQYQGRDINYCVEQYFISQKTRLEKEHSKDGYIINDTRVSVSSAVLIFNIEMKFKEQFNNGVMQLTLFDQEMRPIGLINSNFENCKFSVKAEESKYFKIEIPNHFSNGEYSANLAIIEGRQNGSLPLVLFQNVFSFNINCKDYTTQVSVQIPSKWEIN